ncbi:MAG: alanyl-tRNA editing protein [Candidatus Aenigmatarchaeota archaeon]|nr:MAG: alanyl-tRNA editing protein [Candidatus Aenigmarchaeota archaeon]
MTLKLFYKDPYLTECDARVLRVRGREVLLDQTIFFAFSGGQESDKGEIGGIRVEEARVSGKDIIYFLEKEPEFREGDEVKIRIDGERRKKIMRLHSAAHLVYFIFAEKTGIRKLIGSHIGEEKARLDYSYPQPVSELLPEIEKRVNELISQNLEIKTYPDKDDPEKRWWECEKWKCPCGGLHPKSTGEIGRIKLKRKNIGAGKERIEIFLE